MKQKKNQNKIKNLCIFIHLLTCMNFLSFIFSLSGDLTASDCASS